MVHCRLHPSMLHAHLVSVPAVVQDTMQPIWHWGVTRCNGTDIPPHGTLCANMTPSLTYRNAARRGPSHDNRKHSQNLVNMEKLYLPRESLTWVSMLDSRSLMPVGSGNSALWDAERSVAVCSVCWLTASWQLLTVWGPDWLTTLFTVTHATPVSSTTTFRQCFSENEKVPALHVSYQHHMP